MTDEQIIKALECCLDEAKGCKKCPYIIVGCIGDLEENKMLKDVFALINRQKAEIERLKAEIRNTDNTLASLDRPLIEVKLEAYKEFAERLKNIATKLAIGGTYQYKIVTTEGIEYMLKKLTEGVEPPKNDFKE